MKVSYTYSTGVRPLIRTMIVFPFLFRGFLSVPDCTTVRGNAATKCHCVFLWKLQIPRLILAYLVVGSRFELITRVDVAVGRELIEHVRSVRLEFGYVFTDTRLMVYLIYF